MSLLKVNEVQNYNGSSLTLTASTVSTSAQLNTGGNISVTGSINVSDDSTTRSNLGLGTIATQDSSNVTITGGNISSATLASSVIFPAGGTGNPISVAVIADEKSAGTDGGTFTSGSWQDRDINTELSDPDSIVTISSNQFTLAAGTYVIEWSCPAFRVNAHKTQLYDVTGTQVLSVGSVEYADSTYNGYSRSIGAFIHTISSNNTYKIQHQSGATRTTNGFGTNLSVSVAEIYTIVKISKLK